MPIYLPSGGVTVGTWAAIPLASDAGAGALYYATNVGGGTLLVSNGTRWRPLGGSSVLGKLGAPVAGIVNAEQLVLQTLIPAGLLAAGDQLLVSATVAKSGATDSSDFSVRVGTAGTTADTVVYVLTALSAAARTWGSQEEFKLISATSLQRNGNTTSAYVGLATSVAPAAVTISSASSNALWLSVGLKSNGATDTVTAQGATIQWITG